VAPLLLPLFLCPPACHFYRLVSAAAARDNACAAFNNPIACTEQSTGPLLCSWGISSGANAFERGCRSMYLAEWDAFAAQVQRGSSAAVAAQAMGHASSFMCPGSVGQKSLGCSSIYRKWQSCYLL
jgi:hypothetical protein